MKVAIHPFLKTRYMRLIERKREDDSTTLEKIKERELKWGNRVTPIALAAVIIVNENSLEDFREKV